MERGQRWLTLLGLFAAIGVLAGARSARAECEAVETGELASYRQLSLDDFSGERPREAGRARQLGATAILITTAIAVDAIEIGVELAPDGRWLARPASLCVRAYFLKKESGRRRDVSASWDLRHEQGHFDLTEAHARVLEARLAMLTASASDAVGAKRTLRELAERSYREATARLQAEQDRYDRETRHGHHRSAQGRWRGEIAARLGSNASVAAAR
jgi:Bacterial protein of unknown function (DUF922)